MTTATAIAPAKTDIDEMMPIWRRFSVDLAEWTARNMVQRWDAYVRYLTTQERERNEREGRGKSKSTTVKEQYDVKRLAKHYAGTSVGHLMGVYPIKRDEATGPGEIAFCWSAWMAVDIDCHAETTAPDANQKSALAWCRKAASLGFTPLLMDSNGNGGYHLLLLLDSPIPSAEAYQFLQWLIKDWAALGLPEKPETFPKQPVIREGGFGNVLRLPGRHHTRKHWTKVWDETAGAWLEGENAIRRIIGTEGSPKSILPPESIVIPPRPKPAPCDFGPDPEWDVTCAASALDSIKHLANSYGTWIEIGQCLAGLGNQGLMLWDHWSNSGNTYVPGECAEKWRTFSADGGRKLGTLFHHAKAAGWERPKRPKSEKAKKSEGTAKPKAERARTGAQSPPPGAAESPSESTINWPVVAPDTWLMCCDRDEPNFGYSVEDQGDRVNIVFRPGESGEMHKVIHKKYLRWQDGTPLSQSSAAPGPQPKVDAAELEKRIAEIVAGEGGWKALYRDPKVLRDLAWLETQDSGAAEALMLTIAEMPGYAKGSFGKAMKGHRQAVKDAAKAGAPGATKGKPGTAYREDGSSIVMVVTDPMGNARPPEVLTNFTARIVEVEIRDDGGPNPPLYYRIEASAACHLDGRKVTVTIPAEEYESMGWVLQLLGANFLIVAGRGTKDHVRAAIQSLSFPAPTKRVLTRTGWHDFDDEEGYVIGGGVIKAAGIDTSVTVDLSGAVSLYHLPPPPQGDERRKAILSALRMLEFAQEDRPNARVLAAAMFATVWRSPIKASTYTLQVYGKTNSRKTSFVTVGQQHFGVGMGEKKMPMNWASSLPSLTRALHRIGDALGVIDDMIPRGSARDIEAQHLKMATVLQLIGNGQDRGLANRDSTERVAMPPRCTAISTGEDRNKHESADTRTFPVRLTPHPKGGESATSKRGTIDLSHLSVMQAAAARGELAAAMAGFIQWLAPRRKELLAAMPGRVSKIRDILAHPTNAGNTAVILGEMLVAVEIFNEYAVDSGAITAERAERIRADVEEWLCEGQSQLRDERDEEHDCGDTYIRYLRDSLLSGRAIIHDFTTGQAPRGYEALSGWVKDEYCRNDDKDIVLWKNRPNALMVGWVDRNYYYAIPTNAMNAVRMFGETSGKTFPTGPRETYNTLIDTGKIKPRLTKRNEIRQSKTSQIRVTALGRSVEVHPIPIEVLWPEHDEHEPDSSQESASEEETL